MQLQIFKSSKFSPENLVKRKQETPEDVKDIIENGLGNLSQENETFEEEEDANNIADELITRTSLNVVNAQSLDDPIDPQNIIDDEYEISVVAKDRFVGAGSVFWFQEDKSIYVTDSYGGTIFR